MDRTLEQTDLQVQLDKLEQTISKLQNGERIASVSYDGHSVSYAGISLNELLQQRQVVFATHKGVQS